MRLARLYAILAAFCAILEGGGMNTRKGFIRDGFGLAAILAAQSAPAILVRSMVAARGSFFGIGGRAKVPTAADYVQDGLIAMWDGIENAGWGVHDANATEWKDLIGNIDLPLSPDNDLYFEADALRASNGKYAGYLDSYQASISGPVTFEACWSRDTLFTSSADSQNKFGLLALDVFNGNMFVKSSAANRCDYSAAGLIMQGKRFTLSLAGTYGDSSGNVAAYCNGSLLTVGKSVVSGSYSATQLRIGSGYNNPMSHHCNIRLYNRALTAAELAANYAVDKQRFNLP